jgi:hypothetical protein
LFVTNIVPFIDCRVKYRSYTPKSVFILNAIHVNISSIQFFHIGELMPIISKGAITKGTQGLVTLNKSELLNHAAVLANVYFADSANWGVVSISYVSSIGNQKKTLLFNAADPSPTAYFKSTIGARASFIVHGLTIHDKDGGELFIPNASLVEADFNITLVNP